MSKKVSLLKQIGISRKCRKYSGLLSSQFNWKEEESGKAPENR